MPNGAPAFARSAVEYFPALAAAPCRHAFIARIRGIDVAADRATALARLDQSHHALRLSLGFGALKFITAEQVHRNRVVALSAPPEAGECHSGADGLATNQPGVCLGIYVADCCAIYLVDPVRSCIALVHSGRKGTDAAIVVRAIETMRDQWGCAPSDLIVQLSPCIRPQHYEVDFAADIRAQCSAAGVVSIHDAGICTACHPERYYSYRLEKGRTGRMLALLALA
jgi:copper oxidase (laccase) domain-containing protein